MTGILMCSAALVLTGCEPEEKEGLQIDPNRAVQKAHGVLMAAAESEDPFARTNAMEALAVTHGPLAGDVFAKGLSDEALPVRFSAAMAIGDSQYADAKDRLLDLMASQDTSPTLQCAIIYALYRLDDRQYTSRLGNYLWAPDKWVRANAALVMGKMGHASAIKSLKSLLKDEQDITVQLNIVESLASLGDAQAGQQLEGYCRLPHIDQQIDQQIVAIRAIARLQPPGTERMLQDRLADSRSPRVQVAAAGGLARLGKPGPDGYDLCIESLKEPRAVLSEAFPDRTISDAEIASLQQMAAVSLGWFKQEEAVDDLYQLLSGPKDGVRVASAMSVLLLLPQATGDLLQKSYPAAE
jgi:HEAT repeat protein